MAKTDDGTARETLSRHAVGAMAMALAPPVSASPRPPLDRAELARDILLQQVGERGIPAEPDDRSGVAGDAVDLADQLIAALAEVEG